MTQDKATQQNQQNIGENLVGLMQSLSNLLDEETALVRDKKVFGLEDIGKKKMALVRDFEKNMACLAAAPEGLQAIGPAVRDRLNEISKVCAASARQNASTLKGAMDATRNVVEIIVDAAVKKAKETEGYKDPRKAMFGPSPRDELCQPIAFSRVV